MTLVYIWVHVDRRKYMGLGKTYHTIEGKFENEKDSIYRVHGPDQLQRIIKSNEQNLEMIYFVHLWKGRDAHKSELKALSQHEWKQEAPKHNIREHDGSCRCLLQHIFPSVMLIAIETRCITMVILITIFYSIKFLLMEFMKLWLNWIHQKTMGYTPFVPH